YRAVFHNACGTVTSSAAILTVNQKALTASIIGDPTRPYNGNTNATLTSPNFSLGGLIGADSFTVTQTNGTYNSKDVATANTVTASLAPGNFTPGPGTSASNYAFPSSASGPGHITKTDPTVDVTPYTCPTTTYTGLPHAATYTITGVNGETGATVGTVDVSNTTHTNVGTYSSDSWSFTGTANYNSIAATTITDKIAKADAGIVIHDYSGTYDANSHGVTATITGVDAGGMAAGGSFSSDMLTNVPGSTVTWHFTGGTNYN